MNHMPCRLVIFVLLSACCGHVFGEELLLNQLIGYTELRTDLSGGRHANVRTMRAAVINADGSEHRHVADELVDNANAWTQFAGCLSFGNIVVWRATFKRKAIAKE